ncbi:MAG: glycosyltransferase family 2 protein [Gammaproteobacteria bacterium]|nr:glycosyltransferase family 2 protein [Gammaproteobacteria bacterium]
MSRAPLSAVIITLNAASRLEACLQSVSFADEILVVDAGSRDATLDVARRHGARVVHHDWEGFGKQKRYAVAQAQHPWVLCLDADERVSAELRAAVPRALEIPAFKVYAMPRCNRFMGRWLKHGEGYPDYNLRLFHRDHAQWSEDTVHEKVVTEERIGRLAGDLLHESEAGIAEYLEKQNRYTTLQAQMLYERGARVGVARMLFSPLLRFIKFYFLRLGFLDGLPGLIHITIGCMNSLMKYAKLREMQQASRAGGER